jgi:hypothetical protein
MTLLNAIIINPVTRTVTAQKIGTTLQAMYIALAVDPAWSGTMARVALDRTHDLWIDDNGCLSPGRPVFLIHNRPIAGAAMILSHDEDGQSCDCMIPLAEVMRRAAWTGLETTGDFTKGYGEDTAGGFIFVAGWPIYRQRE